MVDVIVYVTDQAAHVLGQPASGGAPPSADVAELLALLQRLGVTLEPLHPGVEDAQLARQFRVRVAGRAAAAEVAERLRAARAVEGAYVQPPQGPP